MHICISRLVQRQSCKLQALHILQVHQLIPQSGGQMLKIPMRETHVRSLNLAVSVGVGAFEAVRQLDGPVF